MRLLPEKVGHSTANNQDSSLMRALSPQADRCGALGILRYQDWLKKMPEWETQDHQKFLIPLGAWKADSETTPSPFAKSFDVHPPTSSERKREIRVGAHAPKHPQGRLELAASVADQRVSRGKCRSVDRERPGRDPQQEDPHIRWGELHRPSLIS